jgi:serine/threonine-protein kinase HipA
VEQGQKASVIDPDGNLWIAKFPSLKDEKNVGAWEMVVNELAIKAGLNVAEGKIQQFNNKYHTYLTKRFDRTSKGERIHFASAMTMLGYTDGKASHEEGVSYLELVEFLTRFGANINDDLKELWRRIVFNICVKNTDDHLRNHGFLLTDAGWRLSPAYDLNPIEHGTGLNLNISETDNSLDLDLALSVAKHFRLKYDQASQIIDEVKGSVANWRETAKKYNLSTQEQNLMINAFE